MMTIIRFMRQQQQNILITRPLSGQQREYARILGLNPLEEPALEFEFPAYWDRVLATINENTKSDWVFTSKNGVRALEQMMESGLQVRPEIQLFAVGSKTQKALQDLGLDAKIPFQQDSEHLAELIIEEGKIDSVIYFHGNLSRGTMSDTLTEKGIEVIGVEVYKTHIQPVEMPREPVEAILFYSPSAVEGFKQGQGFDEPLPPLFAIGPTTAGALEEETDQPVNKADKPDTKMLLQTVSTYLFRERETES
ncbi:MAG TPA: uroporphyrinogen-III synthase [Balneolaceae bacterium]|nr:uroporphyrinogen-III synthase [Balneolaceae bacterium]